MLVVISRTYDELAFDTSIPDTNRGSVKHRHSSICIWMYVRLIMYACRHADTTYRNCTKSAHNTSIMRMYILAT